MEAQQANEVTKEIRELIGELRRDRASRTTQTVVHKSNIGGFLSGVAVACCIGSFFFTMFIARTINNDLRDVKQKVENDLRDQKAWTEVLRGKVATLEGKINPPKETKP